MATNFPGFSIQGPILSVFESSGNFSKSMFFSFEMVSKFKLFARNFSLKDNISFPEIELR